MKQNNKENDKTCDIDLTLESVSFECLNEQLVNCMGVYKRKKIKLYSQ